MYEVFTNLSIDVVKTAWYKFTNPPAWLDFFTLKILCIIIPIIVLILFGWIAFLFSIPPYFIINYKWYHASRNFLLSKYIEKALKLQVNSSIFEIVNIKHIDTFLLDDVTTLFYKSEHIGKFYYFRNLRLLLFIPQLSASVILIIDPSNYRTIRTTISNPNIINWINDEIRFMLEMRISKKNLYLTLISDSKYEYKSLSEAKRDTV
jgi:hypothetical protein